MFGSLNMLMAASQTALDGYTKLLLHCDGANGGTTFTDSSASAHTMTVLGGAQTSTTQVKFGTASGYFASASSSYIAAAGSSDFVFGNSDFTVDFWLYSLQAAFALVIKDGRSDTWGHTTWEFRLNNTANKLTFFASSGAAMYEVSLISTTSVNNGNWHHVAAVRSGNTWNLYIDGISEANTTSSITINTYSDELTIGAAKSGASSHDSYFDGYLDELRISNGIARWTSNFTPPTTPY